MPPSQEQIDRFEKTWTVPPGFKGWLSDVNNQALGQRFMVTSVAFFIAGGVLALLMRIQLTVSDNDFLGPQVYNELLTMHGSTMMYLFAVPFLEGLALFLLPTMLGSRDAAFPRLSAFSYWTYLFGGIIFYASFIFGSVPDAGWFSYVPLSTSAYSGTGMDFWLLGLALVEIGGIAAGAELVVTVLILRAPGMSLQRIPLLVWALFVIGVMIIFAFTTLLTGTLLLEADRALGTRIFDPMAGGNAHLWQHLFWFFGHPEVYIIFLPATGIVSMVVAASAQRPILGYMLVVMAIVVTGFLSFGLWVHHMYTAGLPELSMQFFAAASLMIGIASGVQVFAWIGTLWGTRPKLNTPFLYVLGFLFIFVIGGITGVMIAVVPFNWQVHDTFFIVAHFHYVLIGGAVFPVFAGIHFWLPKMTGRMLSETLGKWSFWLSFVGFNVAFFPMHIMGFLGMPRRVYTYPAKLGIDGYNIVSTIGAFVFAAGFLLIAANMLWSLRRGKLASANPWGGGSLEWAVPSPPKPYSFRKPPVIYGRNPVWDNRPARPDEAAERIAENLEAAPSRFRATISTDPVSGKIVSVQALPDPSLQPLLATVGLLIAFLGILTEWYGLVPVGAVLAVGTFVRWLYPDGKWLKRIRESSVPETTGLTFYTTGPQSLGWWGMVCFIAICGTALAVMVFAYFYLWLFSPNWPQGGLRPPDLFAPLLAHALLPVAAVAAFWAHRKFRAVNLRLTQAGLAAVGILGAGFFGWSVFLQTQLDFLPQDHAYGSIFYLLGWALQFLVAIGFGLILAAVIRIWTHGNDPSSKTPLQIEITALYWYFAGAAGAVVYGVLYLAPRLLS